MNVGLPDLCQKVIRDKTYFKMKKGNFFKKVRETNIHFKSFLKFDSAHFGINRLMLEKKIF